MMARKKSDVVDLTRRLRLSRKQLLERLFEEHACALRNFARGHMVQEDELGDIVQEVFSRLIRMDDLEERMDTRTGNNRSFLLTIANNIIVDQVRKKEVRRNYSINQGCIEGDKVCEITPEASVAACRELSVVKQVIMDMRPTWRRAFILNRFKYLSYREVADVMGVSHKQVEHYMAKAIDKIRQTERFLNKHGEDL